MDFDLGETSVHILHVSAIAVSELARLMSCETMLFHDLGVINNNLEHVFVNVLSSTSLICYQFELHRVMRLAILNCFITWFCYHGSCFEHVLCHKYGFMSDACLSSNMFRARYLTVVFLLFLHHGVTVWDFS